MTRGGQRSLHPIPGDRSDLAGFPRLADEFCDHMAARGYSERTIGNRRAQLSHVVAWLAERGITRPAEVTRPVLESYQRHLFHYRKSNGDPLSFRSQSQRLPAIRAFFNWAARQRHVLHNPASEIELPRAERRLPRPALTAAEAELVLAQPALADPIGVRDRAMLEVLYSTGIRRSELARLAVTDVDHERQTLLVRQGKGKKDRLIPEDRDDRLGEVCGRHRPCSNRGSAVAAGNGDSMKPPTGPLAGSAACLPRAIWLLIAISVVAAISGQGLLQPLPHPV